MLLLVRSDLHGQLSIVLILCWRFAGAYIARQAAKSVVASGLAKRCLVQISYAIGVAQPLSVHVDTYGTGSKPDKVILAAVLKAFDFRPGKLHSKLLQQCAAGFALSVTCHLLSVKHSLLCGPSMV